MSEIEALYRVATSSEAETLNSLRRRAGLVWRCEWWDDKNAEWAGCAWDNPTHMIRCEECGQLRPSLKPGSKWRRKGTDETFTFIEAEGNFVVLKGTRLSRINVRNFTTRYEEVTRWAQTSSPQT